MPGSPASNRQPELRHDPISGEWVIVAPQRAARPHRVVLPPGAARNLPAFDPGCPFCPGNEAETPPPLQVVPAEKPSRGWAIRVVPNKFAALQPVAPIEVDDPPPPFTSRPAAGHHEVVIDSPLHNATLADLDTPHVARLLRTWRERYEQIRRDDRVEHIIVFKNHGGRAGASIPHPHTQIVGLPLRSTALVAQHQRLQHYQATHGRCLLCDLIAAERAAGRRIVREQRRFVAYLPYASRFAFETWIAPLTHRACFGQASDAELDDLAPLLQWILQTLGRALEQPDYNVILHATLAVEMQAASHWYVQIIPRRFQFAGFELGTGMTINPASPEEGAARLRAGCRPADDPPGSERATS